MSVTGELHQLSPYVLENIKEYPLIIDILIAAEDISRSSDIYQATREIFIEAEENCHLSDRDQEDGKYFISNIFEKIRDDISLILADGNNETFFLGRSWEIIHYFIAGELENDFSLISKKEVKGNHLLLVNPVWGGTEIESEDYAFDRYLTADEVKQIAEALLSISKQDFRERLKIINRLAVKQSKARSYFYNLDAQKESYFWSFYSQFLDYYQDAAKKGNAMLINIG